MGYTLLSISIHLYELLSLTIQCYGHYALLRSMDRVDTFPDVHSFEHVQLDPMDYAKQCAREQTIWGV